MNSKTILGMSLATVFVFAMMANPIFAFSPNLKIESADEFSMTVERKAPGKGVDGHLIIVYAFFTDSPGTETASSFIAYVAAVHPSFNDDTEQTPIKPIIYAHELESDDTSASFLCVKNLKNDPTVTVDGSEITINDAVGTVNTNVIAAYDFTANGLCPTVVYAFELV